MAQNAAKPSARQIRRKRWKRVLVGASIAAPVSIIGLWIAVNRIEWLGPIVADGLRAVVGKEAVTELQNIAYGVQDTFYQYSRRGEKPKAYWEVPEDPEDVEQQAEPSAPSELDAPAAQGPPPFHPKKVGPVHETWSAPGDGLWLPIKLPDLPDLEPHMFKTLLHPDKNRSWAELFVVAIDIRRTDIHLVAGSREPVATEQEAMEMERPAVIPEAWHSKVMAAFNGGFKTEHGSYGMRVDGKTIVAPRDDVCAIALFKDDSVRIATWSSLKARESDMLWWRQTPNCMYEDGEMHPKLKAGHSKKWGATLDGETVIRRSAIGIDAAGQTLYVGISNHTTASALAVGMNHAGAVTVAQLDVNFSYPKFVLFEKPKGEPDAKREAIALADGFEFSVDEYIRKRSPRDFFYVTPRSLRNKTASSL